MSKDRPLQRDNFISRYSQIFSQENWLEKAETASSFVFCVNIAKYDFNFITSEFDKREILYAEILNPFIQIDIKYREKLVHVVPQDYGFLVNLSSTIPPFLLNWQKGEKILDMCAAPGIKSTILFLLHSNFIDELESVELDYKRHMKMQELFKIYIPEANTKTINLDAKRLSGENIYDKILLDAPCSAEGEIIQQNNYLRWSSKLIDTYTNTQKSLLSKAISLVKPGGKIIYSTCTIAPEENEEVLEWALKRFNVTINSVSKNVFPILNYVTYSSGLKKWKLKTFNDGVKNSIRLSPTSSQEAFFVASITKNL